MKSIVLSFALLSSIGIGCTQNKISERDLIGTWKMVITDLEDERNKWNEKDRLEKGNDATERFKNRIGLAVIPFVGELLDGIEIHFTFQKDHTVTVSEIWLMEESKLVQYAIHHPSPHHPSPRHPSHPHQEPANPN